MDDTPADRNLPLVVFGPRSLEYDFGPSHPLSPRRFGPGIELLRAVGADDGPWLEPEPATDEELEWLHSAAYVSTVRAISRRPESAEEEPRAGIGPGDDPPFAGMHEAAATVAGGSIRAMESILRGDVTHAYQPGGGLHHAMRSKASGFCVYNDVALAIARARRDGLRVLYVDLDVHHGDGVQALHYDDPGVLTVSFHESGRWLFPGTGFVDELGEGSAAGTSVNVPLEPGAGPDVWLAAVRSVVPPLAASFAPDIVVSQHGCDGHYWDPLAHLALTTTAMGEAARLVDEVAHRYARGRWFATGGGGYAVYRVVPRVWALTWLAAAHRELPFDGRLPEAWRQRWAAEAARRGEESRAAAAPFPSRFHDDPALVEAAAAAAGRLIFGTGRGDSARRGRHSTATNEETVELVRTVTVPALLRLAQRAGWWRFGGRAADSESSAAPPAQAPAAVDLSAVVPAAGAGAPRIEVLTADLLGRLRLAPRATGIAATSEAESILAAALRSTAEGHAARSGATSAAASGATLVGAVAGEWLVGVALSAPSRTAGVHFVAALGVAPGWRRAGVATSLLRALVAESDRIGRALVALHTVAERDPIDPLPRAVRRRVAEALFRSAGFELRPAPSAVAQVDPESLVAVHLPPSASAQLADAAGRAASTLP